MKKKDRLPDYLLYNSFVYQFFTNFSALLMYEINVLVFLGMGDFFLFFFISRNTGIMIESNSWLEMYVAYILNP